MYSRFNFSLASIITALLTTSLWLGCEGEKDDLPIGSHESSMKCTGQDDKLITLDYFGAHRPVPIYPTDVSHATAAELVYSNHTFPGKERFAVTWVRKTDNKIYFSIWDTDTKKFTDSEQLLSNWPSPVGWIHTLGFDDNCQVISGETTCAWFTWEDSSGDVDRAAVGANGGTYINYDYFDGYAPSGDAGTVYLGWGQYERKKLLAYISRGGSTDRRQIRAKLLNNAGVELSDILLYTTDADFSAYQTAVAWSSVEERWLVAWSENNWPKFNNKNGKVQKRYVNFDGTLGPAPTSPVMYCEGAWDNPNCNISKANSSSRTSENGVRINHWCACKSIWLASSYYSSITDQGVVKDRYRLHQYKWHAQINANGQRVGIPSSHPSVPCQIYCPMTESAFWYGADFTPFQIMEMDVAQTVHHRLKEDSAVSYGAGQDTSSPYAYPQAFRSDGTVAIAVATNGLQTYPTASGLKLTIVDVYYGGCP